MKRSWCTVNRVRHSEWNCAYTVYAGFGAKKVGHDFQNSASRKIQNGGILPPGRWFYTYRCYYLRRCGKINGKINGKLWKENRKIWKETDAAKMKMILVFVLYSTDFLFKIFYYRTVPPSLSSIISHNACTVSSIVSESSSRPQCPPHRQGHSIAYKLL